MIARTRGGMHAGYNAGKAHLHTHWKHAGTGDGSMGLTLSLFLESV